MASGQKIHVCMSRVWGGARSRSWRHCPWAPVTGASRPLTTGWVTSRGAASGPLGLALAPFPPLKAPGALCSCPPFPVQPVDQAWLPAPLPGLLHWFALDDSLLLDHGPVPLGSFEHLGNEKKGRYLRKSEPSVTSQVLGRGQPKAQEAVSEPRSPGRLSLSSRADGPLFPGL